MVLGAEEGQDRWAGLLFSGKDPNPEGSLPSQVSCSALMSFISPTGEDPAAPFLGKIWHTAHEAFEWVAEQD